MFQSIFRTLVLYPLRFSSLILFSSKGDIFVGSFIPPFLLVHSRIILSLFFNTDICSRLCLVMNRKTLAFQIPSSLPFLKPAVFLLLPAKLTLIILVNLSFCSLILSPISITFLSHSVVSSESSRPS